MKALTKFLFIAAIIFIMRPTNAYASDFLPMNQGGIEMLLEDLYDNYGIDPFKELGNGRTISLDSESFDILCRIVEAEATDGNRTQKCNVASCVLNRLYSDSWPGTVKGVVFQKIAGVNQFTPVSDGRYYTVKVKPETILAVDDVLRNGSYHDCEFFCTRTCKSYILGFHSALQEIFYDGIHSYFTNKEEL